MKAAIYAFITILFFGLDIAFAQRVTERDNRAVYNKIEFFFNSLQTDSIYNLASDSFRSLQSLDALRQLVGYYAQFGRLTDTQMVDYVQEIASYDANLGDKYVRIKLAIDTAYQYNLFQIEEIQESTIQVKEDPVISNVEKVDELDHFVDSIARTYIQQLYTQSLAIGLITDNKVKTYFYGETAQGNQTLPTGNSIYEIGSISKTFTATLLANLVENGTIRLEDSIAKFLPDSVSRNPFIQKISFKSLANHTSGLPRLPNNIEQTADYNPQNPYANYTSKELFGFLKSFQAEHEPEENFEYSNLGYGLLGELLTAITKKSYGQLVQDSLAKPLGLTNTAQNLNPKTQHLIQPHNNKGEEVEPWTFGAMSAAGALRSTVNDLLRYAHTQFLIPKNKLEQAMMLTRQFSYFVPPNTDIGLAWHMNMLGDTIYYWHNGGTGGSSAFLAIAPDKRSALIVLANSAVSVDDISTKVLHRIIGTK